MTNSPFTAVSMPGPPSIVSVSAPPSSVSLPSPAWMRSSPASPLIVSFPWLPTRTSPSVPPLSVKAMLLFARQDALTRSAPAKALIVRVSFAGSAWKIRGGCR